MKKIGFVRKRYGQFVNFKLLSWEEAKKDLIFLKAFLEDVGISFEENKLEEEFKKEQREFLFEEGISNENSLSNYLKKGSSVYSPLEGKTNEEGKTANELLNEDDVLQEVTNRVFEGIKEGQFECVSEAIKLNNEAFYNKNISEKAAEVAEKFKAIAKNFEKKVRDVLVNNSQEK